MPKIGSTSLYGTLALLIPKTLESGSFHGLDAARRIRGETSGVLQVEEGAPYPALHRLEGAGPLAAEWG